MTSKLAKLVGVVAGAAALIWAMRDRFISVAASREPNPPAFRSGGEPKKVDAVDGIGPTYAARLSDAGIANVEDLSSADASKVALIAGVSIDRATSWVDQAASLA